MKKIIFFFAIGFAIVFGLLFLQQQGLIDWRVSLPKFVTNQNNDSHGNKLRVTFLDIGQGDATLFQFPSGQTMLVDCGPDAGILGALGRNLAWNQRTIDYLVVTHAHADHFGGCIDVLQRFTVRAIYYSGYDGDGGSLVSVWHQAVAIEQSEEGAQYEVVNAPKSLTIGSSTVSFIYPNHSVSVKPQVPGEKTIDVNDTSVVLRVTYGTQDVLMTGDMEAPLEHYLVRVASPSLPAEILKVGHHGSRSSTSEEFLRVVQPKDAVISAGVGNSYEHPHRSTLYRLRDFGVTTWRTDVGGDILASISPEAYVLTSSKNNNH